METRVERILLSVLFAAGLVLATSGASFANCDDDDPDGSLRAAARATAEANCTEQGRGCFNAVSHGQYVSCIAHEVKALSSGETPSLPKTCKGAVKKCAARSVCGKQDRGFATCCITDVSGDVRCKTGRAENCSGVVGTCASCCDACNGGTGPTCPVQ